MLQCLQVPTIAIQDAGHEAPNAVKDAAFGKGKGSFEFTGEGLRNALDAVKPSKREVAACLGRGGRGVAKGVGELVGLLGLMGIKVFVAASGLRVRSVELRLYMSRRVCELVGLLAFLRIFFLAVRRLLK